MNAALFWTVYGIIAVVMWLNVYRFVYREYKVKHPALTWDNGDRIFAVLWGAWVSFFWPIFLPIAILMWLIVKAKPLLEKLEN